MTERSNSTILGAAGEHYVMCQLLRRSKIAALAPSGVPDADIIVSDSLGSTLAAVQVKARRNIGSDGGWHLKAKHEKMKRDLLFYCFVDFGSSLIDAPKCWVIPSRIVASVLEETHQAWFVMDGRNGRKHQPTEMRRFLPDFSRRNCPQYPKGWMSKFEERWDLIASPDVHGAAPIAQRTHE